MEECIFCGIAMNYRVLDGKLIEIDKTPCECRAAVKMASLEARIAKLRNFIQHCVEVYEAPIGRPVEEIYQQMKDLLTEDDKESAVSESE